MTPILERNEPGPQDRRRIRYQSATIVPEAPKFHFPRPTDPVKLVCGDKWVRSQWHKPRRGRPGYYELTSNMLVETMGRHGYIESMRAEHGFSIWRHPLGGIIVEPNPEPTP